MKKNIIILAFLFLTVPVYSQSLSFTELKALITLNHESINNELTNNSWVFYKKITKNSFTKYVWDNSSGKVGSIVLMEPDWTDNVIIYKSANSRCYNDAYTEVKNNQYVQIEIYNKNGVATYFYEKAGYVVELSKIQGVLSQNQTLYAVSYMSINAYKSLKKYR
jgi:hypothetical protein